ncbi:hypothetical protein RHGRI_004087 [Rhododendron griersonianum]|uniref:Uncharacterized protein n=1 Tax=Rhododendron griersonianum TaxID=479676 RepID=A0AAV6L933_9ERIC|nr:hypothetical protein RHGRI_004087 [Rhododendron griersonianum]
MQVRSISLPTKYIDFRLPFVLRVFEKSLQYVKRFSRYKNPDAVRQAREYPLVAVVYVCSNLLPVGYGTKSLNLNQYSESLVDTSWLNLRTVLNYGSRGRALDEEAIEKVLNDLSMIKKFD